MKNLHLKNLVQKPNGLVILKKLNDPNYYSSKYIRKKLIKEIELYIYSLTFKNKDIEKFTMHFLANLKYANIKCVLPTTKQIITLLYKYKLNELDIGSDFDVENMKKEIGEKEIIRQTLSCKTKIQIKYDENTNLICELGIYIDPEEKNKISEIFYCTY